MICILAGNALSTRSAATVEIQNLKAFLLVAEHASFSAAAEALHLTQPAVSKRVAALEQQFNTTLFDRRALLPHANAIIRSLDQASQTIQDLSGEVGGRLRLATSHHVGLHRLPPVLRQFSERFPAVSLDIEFMDSEQAYDEISRGAVELAIVTLAPR